MATVSEYFQQSTNKPLHSNSHPPSSSSHYSPRRHYDPLQSMAICLISTIPVVFSIYPPYLHSIHSFDRIVLLGLLLYHHRIPLYVPFLDGRCLRLRIVLGHWVGQSWCIRFLVGLLDHHLLLDFVGC